MIQFDDLLGLFDSPTEEQWAGKLFAIAHKCGFRNALFGMIPDRSVALESAFVRTNYPTAWRAQYEQQQLHEVDPTVAHCMGSMLPIVWKPSLYRSATQHVFYEDACGHGLVSGITLPIHGAQGEFGMLSFAGPERDHLGRDGELQALAMLTLVRDYALESARRFLPGPEPAAPEVQLTARELECLRWAMLGKSSWEISRILRRSEATVNFHFANSKKKFNVQTRQQAVVKAIKLGLLTPA